LAQHVTIDQSIAHNGVCLTVIEATATTYQVTAIAETLQKTNLNQWQIGTKINLETAISAQNMLDGHLVQGHVDAITECLNISQQNGSWVYTFALHANYAPLVVEKGSVCLNGVSLTCFNATHNSFDVAIIPYTYNHTNFNTLKIGQFVNIEFDILGKYVQRYMNLK
jgi:riboflavin synthase